MCRGQAAVGSRLLTVWVDGVALSTNIDIFKEVGLNTAVSTSGTATASSDRMNVTLTAAVCTHSSTIPVTTPEHLVLAVILQCLMFYPQASCLILRGCVACVLPSM